MLRSHAMEMRGNPMDAEHRLWFSLRKKQLAGFRFRRQQVIGSFIVDFVCFERMLIVEVDGSQHQQRQSYDKDRTTFLEKRGFRVIRFWSNEVLAETDRVVEVIYRALIDPPPPSFPPPMGEGS